LYSIAGQSQDQDYQLCQRVWQDNDMQTVKEFLIWYNNKDIKPMLEAIDKMFQFNQNRRIDMFKDISVPGLVLKYMFQDLPDYFTVPNEKNKDLYMICTRTTSSEPRTPDNIFVTTATTRKN